MTAPATTPGAARARHVAPDPAFARLFDAQAARLPGHDRPPVADWRRRHFERFAATGLPSQRVERWKYTNIAKVANVAMDLAARPPVKLGDVSRYFAGGPLARRLIFVNGHLAGELSHVRGLPEGVRVAGLETLLREAPELLTTTLADEPAEPHGFADLNAAFVQDGAWIELADGAALDHPLQLLFLTVGQGAAVMAHPRLVVRLGKGSRLHLIESHVGLAAGHCLTNLVAQHELAEGASLTHDRLQLGSAGTSFVGTSRLRLGQRAVLKQTLATLGGALVRNETDLQLAGRFIEAQLNGVYMPVDAEHVDNVIQVHHAAPDCHSDQFYKGVIADRARAVFAGKIVVHQDAQRTNAFQTNNNLLLSDDAEIDSKPELEIYADDVKCSHGATCGDLDATALFYLRSRGLDRAQAESILTYAFAAEVIDRFADPAAKRQARESLIGRTPGGVGLMELV